MRHLNWILILLILYGNLVACAPVAGTQQPAATPEQVIQRGPTLKLLSLDDVQVRAGLDSLIELQRARTAEDVGLITKWHAHPVLTWNEQARYWVAFYGMDPVIATRLYALTSVAQQRALDSFSSIAIDPASRRPTQLDSAITPVEISSNPFESALLIGATETVFISVLTDTEQEVHAMVEEARHSLLISGNILPSDLQAAQDFGRTVADELIQQRKNDGSADAKEFDPFPSGDGIWKPDPFRAKPEQPGWGKVTPWLMSSPDEFRAPTPPSYGSVAFRSALEEVRHQVENNTQGEMAIAQKWADKRFSSTPPGHWNSIAADLIQKYGLSDRDASHVFSTLNMAMMDAGIACWDTKYYYLVLRPWQVDSSIPSLVGYPNHPSYPSGHSTFSSAAAEALDYFFPAERESLSQMVEEASISRLYAGIHYRFDLDAGKNMGRQIGKLAGEFAARQNWSTFVP